MGEPTSPADLLRLREAVEPYPIEPSDQEIARAAGIPVEMVVRFDLNTLGDGPLPGVIDALARFDARRVVEYGDPSYRELRAAISAEGQAGAATTSTGPMSRDSTSFRIAAASPTARIRSSAGRISSTAAACASAAPTASSRSR